MEWRWVATCECGLAETEEIVGYRGWVKGCPWGERITRKYREYVWDEGPEHPGWECLRGSHEVVVGCMPQGYLPVRAYNGE
jgi:hypothetical protein